MEVRAITGAGKRSGAGNTAWVSVTGTPAPQGGGTGGGGTGGGDTGGGSTGGGDTGGGSTGGGGTGAGNTGGGGTGAGNTGGGSTGGGLYWRANADGATVEMSWREQPYAKYRYRWKEGFATDPTPWTPWKDIPDSDPGGANSTGYTVTIPELEGGQYYTFRFEGVHADGTPGSSSSGTLFVQNPSIVNTSAEAEELPQAVALSQNYPNPFNPSTSIDYELPKGEYVRLSVHDMHGREVAELLNGFQFAGRHSVRFDGTDLPSGAYVYRLVSGAEIRQAVMMLVK